MGDKSVDKLIIHHGERVTEHDLRDTPVVIGRDPECDLFFADKKLSRKHARVERFGEGIRLVDLESRNGTWVNEMRVEAHEVAPGDEIRLGGLRIHIERDQEQEIPETNPRSFSPRKHASSRSGHRRALLRSSPEFDAATSTVSPSSDDSSTVFLSSSPSGAFAELDEADETLKKPEPERTVVLPGQLPEGFTTPAPLSFAARRIRASRKRQRGWLPGNRRSWSRSSSSKRKSRMRPSARSRRRLLTCPRTKPAAGAGRRDSRRSRRLSESSPSWSLRCRCFEF